LITRTLPLLLVLAACGGTQPPGTAPSAPIGWCGGRVELRNTASVTVEQAYISDGGHADWGPDLLAPGTLPPGGVQQVTARPGSSSVRIVFANGRAAEMAGMDVCATPILLIQQNALLAQR